MKNTTTLHLLRFSCFFLFFVALNSSCSDSTEEFSDMVMEEVKEDAQEETDGTGDEGSDGGDESDGGDGGNGDDSADQGNQDDGQSSCIKPEDFVFNEKDGIVKVEFEDAVFTDSWELRSSDMDHSGDGYMVWTGSQYLNQPGNGLTTYKIKISNTGTYRFVWRSSVTIGQDGTEHNDTWLRFTDAADFFGEKNNGSSVVYPKGTGKTPNPNGSSTDGWFKIYRSGNNLSFKWQSSTSDNDGHQIYATFSEPGTYTLEISARSSGHAIDKFVLFNRDSYSESDVVDDTVGMSAISCGN